MRVKGPLSPNQARTEVFRNIEVLGEIRTPDGVVTPGGGGGIEYTRLTLTEDIVTVADVPSEITAWRVNPLPYGLYAYRMRLEARNTTGLSGQVYVQVDDASSGKAYAHFSAPVFYGINTIASGQDFLNNSSGAWYGKAQDPLTGLSSTSLGANRIFRAVVPEGYIHHNNVGDAYYGTDLRLMFESSVVAMTLKAGSYFEYALIEAF